MRRYHVTLAEPLEVNGVLWPEGHIVATANLPDSANLSDLFVVLRDGRLGTVPVSPYSEATSKKPATRSGDPVGSSRRHRPHNG